MPVHICIGWVVIPYLTCRILWMWSDGVCCFFALSHNAPVSFYRDIWRKNKLEINRNNTVLWSPFLNLQLKLIKSSFNWTCWSVSRVSKWNFLNINIPLPLEFYLVSENGGDSFVCVCYLEYCWRLFIFWLLFRYSGSPY